MNEKIERINLFLNQMLSLSKSYNLTEYFVYHQLIELDVNENDKSVDNSYFFSDLINYFKKKSFIEASTSNNNYFCYFHNRDEWVEKGFPCIKMYVPLDSNHIKEGSRQLFAFMEENNIFHQSKIASCIQSNDIILRVEKKEDALLVQEFINNNKYIQEGLIKPNPFAITNNNIAYTNDGKLSYNNILSSLICDYIKHIKNGSLLNGASFLGFKLYINEVYKKYFLSGVNLRELENVFLVNKPKKFFSKEEYIANYMEILELIMLSLNPEKNIKDYYINYDNLCSANIKDKRINHIKTLQDKFKQKEDIDIESIELLAKEMTKVMVKKYGYDEALKRFKNICKYKIITNVTRDNNLRIRLTNRLLELVNYVENKCDNKAELLFAIVRSEKDNKKKAEKEQVLEFASIKTYVKYVLTGKSVNQLIYALEQCSLGDYDAISNDDYARQNLVIKVKPQEINDVIKSSLENNGYTIDSESNIYPLYNEYISDIVENKVKARKGK